SEPWLRCPKVLCLAPSDPSQSAGREKRSQALRGRNLARETSTDGVPKAQPASGGLWLPGVLLECPARSLWTPEPCLRKSRYSIVPAHHFLVYPQETRMD